MSARSRYLQAISPRGDDIPHTPSPKSNASKFKSPSPSSNASQNSYVKKGGVVGGSGDGNTNSPYNVNLKSPSEIRGRKVLVVEGGSDSGGEVGAVGATRIGPSVNNNTFVRSLPPPPPPPPPPPGPPPKKVNKAKQQQQHYPRGTDSSVGSGGSGSKKYEHTIVNSHSDKAKTAVIANRSVGAASNESNNINDNNEQEGKQMQQWEEEKVAKSGSPWSPQEEIQGGSVAKFQQMLWGGSARGGGTAVGAGGVMGGERSSSCSGGGSMLPPATPPRHTTGSNSLTLKDPSPRYKRNAPPPLENKGREDETSSILAQRPTTTTTSSTPPTSMRRTPTVQLPTPPSRILSSPLRSASVNNTPISRGPLTSSSSSSLSSLRQRVGNILSLTPLDTSFGKSVDDGNTEGEQSLSSSPSQQFYPARDNDDHSNDLRHNTAAASLYSSPGLKAKDIGETLTPNDGAQDDQISSHPPPAAAVINNDEGISTFTAFKRQNVKVGLVFTRRSAQHPDVAVISRIMPESIFSRHILPSPGGGVGGGTSLEGSEVIAVNGTPVRDPRHAAELVARAVEEVRLTVKRGSRSGSSHLDLSPGKNHSLHGVGDGHDNTENNSVENVRNENSGKDGYPRERMARTLALIDASSLSQRTKVVEREMSQLSARTEERDKDSSALEGMGENLDSDSVFTEKRKGGEEEEEWRTWKEIKGADLGKKSNLTVMSSSTPSKMATPKSAEIAERRRKVAQAMLLSEELVEDPIKGDDSNYFVTNNDGEDANADSRRMLTEPIQLNQSNDDDEGEENSTNVSSGVGGNRNSGARSTACFSTASSPSTALSVAVNTALSGVSGTPSNVSSASAADRRRRAALEMYHSSVMVPDNVDDVRLGTIDVFSPPLTPKDNSMTSLSSWMKATPLNDVGRVTSFGSTTSKARTDVTTSSVATARMGGSGNRANSSSGEVESAVATLASNSFTSLTASSPSSGFNSGKNGDAQAENPTNAPTRLESPAAQRRRERAAHRQLIGAEDRGGDFPVREGTPKVGDGYWPKIQASKSPAEKATASKSVGTPPHSMPASADMAQWQLLQAKPANRVLASDPVCGTPDHFRLSKSSEESSTVASGVASGVGSSANSGNHRSSRSALGFSKIKSRSRLREGSLDKMDGQKTVGAQLEEDAPKKKKPSIFGVARLIRKASSRKPKSSDNDTNLFQGASPMSFTGPSTVSSASKAAATPVIVEEKRESDEFLVPPTLNTSSHLLAGKDPFSNNMSTTHGDGSWEGSDFFKDNPFTSSLFEIDLASGSNGSKDAFGFPTKPVSDGVMGNKPLAVSSNADRVDANTIFNLDVIGHDSWADPAAVLSVNVTPQRDNVACHVNDHQHDNVDANSYDESEMSEVTDPTFSSSSIIQTTKGKNIVDNSDSSIKENHKRESRQHIDRRKKLPLSSISASFIEKPPPLVSLGTIESENEREDKNRDLDTTLPVAKSRILSKYAKSGKVRRGAVHSSIEDKDKIEEQSSSRSIGSVGSSSLNSGTENFRLGPETSPAMKSKNPISSNLSTACKGGATTAASASANALAEISHMSGGASPLKQQHRATSSPLPRRRKSPVRTTTASTDGNTSLVKPISSPTRSPNKKYSSPYRMKKVSPSAVENPAYYSMETRLGQIKDPIQRAGVKLLWAAAIPIQTQARRFMARQVAIRRMCAVLTIQAFARRWIAERDLEIAIWSAIQIQASFRGWFARDSLEDKHYCATQIQRVARGYLATMHVFENLYSITIVQSIVRMHLAINHAVDRLSSIITIQSWWRGVNTRQLIQNMDYSAVAIQTQWRRYIAQITYQFDIIDIIIVQSVARRWKDRRALATNRLQCFARVILAKKKLREKKAMHALFTRHISATKIQARWRSYIAQVDMLVTIVNVIVIQSLWRRRNAMKMYMPLLHRMKLAKERKRQNSAIAIQSTWRGFVVYSTYLIKRYENKAASTIQATWRGYWQATTYSVLYCAIIKVQSFVRGCQERSWYAFQHRCATIIQASSRRLLVRKECHTECMVSILIAAAANSLRMRNAAKRLQFWWMDEIWKKKEKHAALVIERFFIYVKKEVEREVEALRKKKKERRRRRKMKQSDDYILERAWLGVADDTVPPVAQTALLSHKAVASHNPAIVNGAGDKFSSTKLNQYRSKGVIQTFDEDVESDVSGLTDLDFGYRNNGTRKIRKKSNIELEEDFSLEEAFRESEAEMAKELQRDVTDEFTHRYDKSRHSVSGKESSPYRDQRSQGYRGYEH